MCEGGQLSLDRMCGSDEMEDGAGLDVIVQHFGD